MNRSVWAGLLLGGLLLTAFFALSRAEAATCERQDGMGTCAFCNGTGVDPGAPWHRTRRPAVPPVRRHRHSSAGGREDGDSRLVERAADRVDPGVWLKQQPERKLRRIRGIRLLYCDGCLRQPNGLRGEHAPRVPRPLPAPVQRGPRVRRLVLSMESTRGQRHRSKQVAPRDGPVRPVADGADGESVCPQPGRRQPPGRFVRGGDGGRRAEAPQAASPPEQGECRRGQGLME